MFRLVSAPASENGFMTAAADDFGQRGLGAGRCFVAVLVASAAATAVAAEGLVLDMAGGGMLPGGFVATAAGGGPRQTLPWLSPQFLSPLEFRLDEIVGVRSTGAAAVEPRGFSCRLAGGDSVDGDLREIDGRHVVMVPPGGEPVRIDRGLVASIARRKEGGTSGYVGPGGLVGWTQTPESSWREEAGRLVTDVRNAEICRDVGGPPRARYDVVVSWRDRAEFSLAVAAGDGQATDPYRLEMLTASDGVPAAMLVRQEAKDAQLEPLDVPDAGGAVRVLRLSLFVDQPAGRLAVAVAGQDGLVEVAVPPAGNRGPSGSFRLQVFSGELCLERLGVSQWRSDDAVPGDPEVSRVLFADGTAVAGEVVSLDPAGTIVLKTPAGEEPRELDTLDEIVFADRGLEEVPEASVRVVRRGGGVLTGDLVAIGDDALAITRTGIDGSVSVPIADLQSLVSLRAVEPRPLPGRFGTLRVGDATVPGCLVDAAAWGGGLAWQPAGSEGGSPLAAAAGGAASAVVDYADRDGPAGEPHQDADEVELGGIGGAVNADGAGGLVLTMLTEEGAAARDGRIMAGDRIIAIRPTKGAAFVETAALEEGEAINLLRGRVGTPVALRIERPDGKPLQVELVRGLLGIGDRAVLAAALAAHERVMAAQAAAAGEAAGFPSVMVLRSGDVVPASVERIDSRGILVRSPVVASGGGEPVVVDPGLVRVIEFEATTAMGRIKDTQWQRLLTLPRAQRSSPPTHLLRMKTGDYLRGRLESIDAESVRFSVLGRKKQVPRDTVARVIWLHADEIEGGDQADADDAAVADEATPAPDEEPEAGLLAQGISADGSRSTLVAERMEGPIIVGTSPAFGPGRIDVRRLDRLLLGKAVGAGDEPLPFAKWRLKLAPLPRALREKH